MNGLKLTPEEYVTEIMALLVSVWREEE